MDKKIAENIQGKVEGLLLTLGGDLRIATKDQCSEVARLVGCWILNECPGCEVQVWKGELSGELAHDILVVKIDNLLYLTDPTIWQIFPESESIFVGSGQNALEVINLLTVKYGGTWGMSEVMKNCDERYQRELLTTIHENSQA
ncbi:MAG: hypothetical protein AAB590_01830 [Patescibacteria group bacterium]